METAIRQQKWYALKVIANQEKKVKSYVEKEIKISNLEGWVKQIIIPTEKVLIMVKGKKVIREKNTMPGYLFIEADLSNGEILPTLEKISGVYGFLSTKEGNKIPIALRDKEIERFIQVEDETGGTDNLDWDKFEVGEKVKILEGAFATFEGTIKEVETSKSRMTVIVTIFQRATPVDVTFAQVEKILSK